MPPDLQSIIDLIHLPSLLRCEPKLVQYLLTQNKAFQSTLSRKSGHVQQTDILKRGKIMTSQYRKLAKPFL